MTALNINMVVDKIGSAWTIGGGLEHRFARNWTAREVRYADLGNTSVTCTPTANPNCGFPYRGEFSNTLLMGLVGVSLKFEAALTRANPAGRAGPPWLGAAGAAKPAPPIKARDYLHQTDAGLMAGLATPGPFRS